MALFSLGDKGSKEKVSSVYKKDVKTPQAMEVPAYAETMLQEFMKSFMGEDYSARISKPETKLTADQKNRMRDYSNHVRLYDEKARQHEVRAEQDLREGRDPTHNQRAAQQWRDAETEMQQRLDAQTPVPLDRTKKEETPYEKAIRESYGALHGREMDVLDYMEQNKGLISDAATAAGGKHSNLLDTIINRTLSGEGAVKDIGLAEGGMQALIDRLTQSKTIGVGGDPFMSYTPKANATMLQSVLDARAAGIDQLAGLGQERYGVAMKPSEIQYAEGLKPLQYASNLAETLPGGEGGALLQQLAGMKEMWQPPQEKAVEYGAQVPLVTETEDSRGRSSAGGSLVSLL